MAKVKAKKSINPELEKNTKKIKNIKITDENDDIIKRFLLLFVIIVIIVIGVYFLTTLLVDKRTPKSDDNTLTGEVNSSIVSVGTMLNRPYNEYYVMVYDADDAEAIYYSSLITNYEKKENAKKIYFCNLGNKLNSDFSAKGGESNPEAKTIDELKFGKVTLIKVKDGKINKYIENIDDIKATLQ